MHPSISKSTSALAPFAGGVFLFTLGASPAMAASVDVYLKAQAFDMAMADGATVPMWGLAECDADWLCGDPTVPGPRIDAAPGDTLTLWVQNTLPTPVSIVVPGQGGAGDPEYFTDALGRARVESFTYEVAPGDTDFYTWDSVTAGTYLYQSGTLPSIQVPMGLYGALVVGPDASVTCATGTAAYATADSCHDVDALLLFSEVDPWLNEAIDAAGGVVADYPATVDYYPYYLLVNGESSLTLPAGDPGDTTLLRFLNAGLETHYPAIEGLQVALLAEDAYLYPGLLKVQNAVDLPAGKTVDVLVTVPTEDATYALYDRAADGNYGHGGGVDVALEVGLGTPAEPDPTVYTVDDAYAVTEDTPYAAASVLVNDVGLAGASVSVVYRPDHGELVLAADGTFTYTPDPDFSGFDGFTYSAWDGSASFPGWVSLEVSFENDPPTAREDGLYTNALGTDIVVDPAGVLANDGDPDGDALSAVLVTPPATGTLTLAADGSFVYQDGVPGSTVTFTYYATDGIDASDVALVTLEVQPVSALALHVVDPAGAPVSDYRWVVQEDRTFQVDPATPPAYLDSQTANFHRSHMPVVAQGIGAQAFASVALDPTRHYYVSVLPLDGGNEDGTGHTMGGTRILEGETDITVVVNDHPIPTAQISVLVFEDAAPTNGVPDAGEQGLGGYQITLEDAGGRYGQNGGQMMQDAFGGMLANALDCFGGSPPPMGVILTCPDGTALIRNLAPGKYGVTATPPVGETASWVQTSTIEGTRVIDAWVKAGEPAFFLEFGGAGPHAFIGFVNPERTAVPSDVPETARTNTVTGNVTLFHDPRPPGPIGSYETGSYDALAFTRAWVGLNSIGGDGPSFATVQAEADGTFVISGIPDGLYQLVAWDTYLDQIIAFQAVTLTGSGADLGAVPVWAWFTRLEHNVFLDTNEDGVRQDGEMGLSEQAINLRFRDGSIYQSYPTDLEGFVPFDQVFPFFSWQVAEVDYTRFKATGVTVTVDGGGDVGSGPYAGLLSVQDGSPRTETGPVLVEAFQGFPGQTSLFDWGKAPYAPGENGGISGIVHYASTRAENDPRLAAADPWEPGVPGVKVRLYRRVATDFEGGTALALVDEVTTDSWDDALPTGCPGEDPTSAYVTDLLGADQLSRCYDGWRNYNQVRPGVFDGGYAFLDIAPGTYVVEVEPPPGYELVKEEDLNVGYGDVYDMAPAAMMMPGGAMVAAMPDMAMIEAAMAPEPGIAQPPCVGDTHVVPDTLSLFPSAMSYAPFAGTERPMCDRKEVTLTDQGQAGANFFLFTSTPVAAQYTGLILDDLAIENRPASPGLGEKWSPAYMPVSMRDMNGHEVYRSYGDGYGRYNGIAASTYTANLPMPSGYSPAMYSVCLNDPGDGAEADPYRDPDYGTHCYTMQFMPGTTTYLDTPVLPQSAFAAGFNPVDCDLPDATPELDEIVGGALVAAGGTIELTSVGSTAVPNPAFRGPLADPPYDVETVLRDYGFGDAEGTVTLGGTVLDVTHWDDTTIRATVPAGTSAGSYPLAIARSTGEASVNTVTVTVGSETPIVVGPGESIQDAIDIADPGDLILVQPGVYEEQVILWKPLRLQGAGAGSTVIEAAQRPAEDLATWREKVQMLVDAGDVDLLPGQAAAPLLFGGGVLETELGAGILVLAADGAFDNVESRIDGFTITGANIGGGIVVNGYAHYLQISNNVVTRNSGGLSGGIRVGAPRLATTGDGPFAYNVGVVIDHNVVSRNGAIGETGAGGGISLNTGSDDYTVSDNFVCGNFTSGDGAGIGHLGLSDNGVIASNEILFNQSYDPTTTRSGGGIFVGGEAPEPPALTLGAGSVTIDGNRIQGNQAASGHGGGIRAEYFNGRDVELASAGSSGWYRLDVFNNMVVDNVAGWSGAGISLQDVARGSIVLNTIAHNDSTATAGPLIDLATLTSEPQPAGISSAPHNVALADLVPGAADYSHPDLTHNILWQNRAFSYDATGGTPQLVPVLAPSSTGSCATGATYWDVGVLGGEYALVPTWSIVTSVTGLPASNRAWNPQFSSEYCNGARELGDLAPMTPFQAFEEGGNYVEVRYGPLTQDGWDYHLQPTSPAINYHPTGAGGGWPPATGITEDIDLERRGFRVDLGADEVR